MKRPILMMMLFLTGIIGVASAEETLYVQSVEARIMASPKFVGQTIAVVKRGEQLKGLGRDGSWHKVIYEDIEGWVAKILVAGHKPIARRRTIQAESDIGKKARRRASAVATAGAARGLTAEDRRRVDSTGNVDFSALAYMESIELSEDDTLDFLKQATGE